MRDQSEARTRPASAELPPKKLKHAQQWAAFLVAAGTPDRKICRKTHLTDDQLSRMKIMPLFKSLVREYTDEIVEQGFDVVLAQLLAEAPNNIQFLKDVRDGVIDDDPDNIKLRLEATKLLMAPTVEKRQKIEAKTTHSYKLPPGRREAIDIDVVESVALPHPDAFKD